MNRIALPLTFLLALIVVASASTAWSAPLDVDTIKAALRTATPEEDGFIDRVVAMVNRGALPRDLFDSTFLWAKKKPRNKFQYFKRGLILRAEQQGIHIGG